MLGVVFCFCGCCWLCFSDPLKVLPVAVDGFVSVFGFRTCQYSDQEDMPIYPEIKIRRT